LIMLIRD